MLKHLVPKFRSDLSVHFKDIAEKQVPAKLKTIVNAPDSVTAPSWSRGSYIIIFNISHCANVLILKSQQGAEVNGREA